MEIKNATLLAPPSTWQVVYFQMQTEYNPWSRPEEVKDLKNLVGFTHLYYKSTTPPLY